MEFQQIIDLCIQLMNIQFTVYGVSITVMQLFIFVALSTIILGVVYKLFDD